LTLRGDFPDSTIRLDPGRLTWTGRLKPTPISETYLVKVEYGSSWRRPNITILAPKLVAPQGGHLPHVFPGNKPCLHFPGEWTPEMLIAKSIVPWASEWLLHYEIWRTTGTWTGGGHEPSHGSKRDRSESSDLTRLPRNLTRHNI
jgi:hypothetical protein